jgi:hypothetical protein
MTAPTPAPAAAPAAAAVNAELTLIPDKAEVWIALKSEVTDLTKLTPANISDDLAKLGWSFVGLIDDRKGIPLTPSGEVKEYNAFGYPAFRMKFRKGKLTTGFTTFELNDATKKIVLPGSTPNKMGIPKNTQIYVLYRFIDEDVTGGHRAWMSLRPALAELKSHGGIIDGELSYAEIVVHHSPDANQDVFLTFGGPAAAALPAAPATKTFTIGAGVTAYTVTVDGKATASITTLTSAGLQTALQALAGVGASGVAVTGTGSGPFTAVFTVAVSTVTAAGTGGTVTVA